MERGPNSRALVTQTESGKTQPGARTEEEGMQCTIKQHIDTLSQFLSETRELFLCSVGLSINQGQLSMILIIILAAKPT
jgi:hypothetical protein